MGTVVVKRGPRRPAPEIPDGELVIEFRDREVVVGRGQLVTVPAGVPHRTRPVGQRSVNLTFERAGAETIFEE